MPAKKLFFEYSVSSVDSVMPMILYTPRNSHTLSAKCLVNEKCTRYSSMMISTSENVTKLTLCHSRTSHTFLLNDWRAFLGLFLAEAPISEMFFPRQNRPNWMSRQPKRYLVSAPAQLRQQVGVLELRLREEVQGGVARALELGAGAGFGAQRVVHQLEKAEEPREGEVHRENWSAHSARCS